MDLKTLENCCFELNTIRNDFIFIHTNCKGHDFLTIHKLTEEYYKELQDNIDSLMEIYTGLNQSAFNLNKRSMTFIDKADFESVLELCRFTVDTLEKARDSVDQNGFKSEIDGMLEYWEKQARFIALRFCL